MPVGAGQELTRSPTLLLGASSQVGLFTIPRLLAQGRSVWAVNRSGKPAWFPEFADLHYHCARVYQRLGRTDEAIDEARRRIRAVSLVHRRLYTSEHLENIEAARYLDELIGELIQAAGKEWEPLFHRDLQPVMLPNDRAVSVGLVLTELVINTPKYAYPGAAAGPVRVRLVQDRQFFRLSVADEGVGRGNARKGFGSRMIDALVATLDEA